MKPLMTMVLCPTPRSIPHRSRQCVCSFARVANAIFFLWCIVSFDLMQCLCSSDGQQPPGGFTRGGVLRSALQYCGVMDRTVARHHTRRISMDRVGQRTGTEHIARGSRAI